MSGDHNQYQKDKSYLDDMDRYKQVRELVKDPSLRIKDIVELTGYDKGHVSRLRKASQQFECPRCGHCCQVDEEHMNKEVKSPESKRLHWHIKPDGDDLRVCFDYSGKPEDKYIRFVRAGQQEPVAWMHTTGTGHVYFRKKPQDKVFNPHPVYVAPPRRKWVGLTDEEHDRIKSNYHNMTWTLEMFARAIESKLKEKNT